MWTKISLNRNLWCEKWQPRKPDCQPKISAKFSVMSVSTFHNNKMGSSLTLKPIEWCKSLRKPQGNWWIVICQCLSACPRNYQISIIHNHNNLYLSAYPMEGLLVANPLAVLVYHNRPESWRQWKIISRQSSELKTIPRFSTGHRQFLWIVLIECNELLSHLELCKESRFCTSFEIIRIGMYVRKESTYGNYETNESCKEHTPNFEDDFFFCAWGSHHIILAVQSPYFTLNCAFGVFFFSPHTFSYLLVHVYLSVQRLEY